jgi:hypothetical protein
VNILGAIACAIAIGFPVAAVAKKSPHEPASHAATGVTRNAQGKIARSGRARGEFKRTHPCPSTGQRAGGCPGYVIDHVHPLKRGGPDTAANMQWQTKAEARAKDRIE